MKTSLSVMTAGRFSHRISTCQVRIPWGRSTVEVGSFSRLWVRSLIA